MNLSKRADYDLKVAIDYITPEKNPNNDEYFYDISAYHIQQAIEKKLKYALIELFGEDETSRRFKTHNIDYLIYKLEEYGFEVNQKLKEMAETITEWEANSRYGTDIVATKSNIIAAIELCKELDREIKDFERSQNVYNQDKEKSMLLEHILNEYDTLKSDEPYKKPLSELDIEH